MYTNNTRSNSIKDTRTNTNNLMENTNSLYRTINTNTNNYSKQTYPIKNINNI